MFERKRVSVAVRDAVPERGGQLSERDAVLGAGGTAAVSTCQDRRLPNLRRLHASPGPRRRGPPRPRRRTSILHRRRHDVHPRDLG